MQLSVYDPCSHESYLSSGDKGLKNSGLNSHSNPALCNADKVLCQLSYQANWELVVMWVNMVELKEYKTLPQDWLQEQSDENISHQYCGISTGSQLKRELFIKYFF